MRKTNTNAVMNWLFVFTFIVAFLVVFGGYVRLTRSGLSIVEWNPISGVIPPIGQQAWMDEFAKYQETPEYLEVNTGMTLDEYKFIFYMEWIHRLIARLAGLFYAIPVFYFLFKKTIPLREFGIYFAMGLLFIAQAFMGWFMVASGLVDRPSVSHFSLTAHLLFALTLIGVALWTALGHKYGFPDTNRKAGWSLPSQLAFWSAVILIVQIAYGGMTAGLKAGHVSDTWPLMFGRLIPPNLFNSLINLLETPQTIVFIHRWFAFAVLIAITALYFSARAKKGSVEVRKGSNWLLALVIVQIILGVLTVIFHVQVAIALAHQTVALALFALTIFLIHRLRASDKA